MHTQSNQPAFRSLQYGRHLGAALVKGWTRSVGVKKPSLVWFIQPWGSSLPYSPSPSDTGWSLLSEWKLVDHSKKARTNYPYPYGSMARCRSSEQGSGDCLATRPLPSP